MSAATLSRWQVEERDVSGRFVAVISGMGRNRGTWGRNRQHACHGAPLASRVRAESSRQAICSRFRVMSAASAQNPDGQTLARAGIVYEVAGFYVRETVTAFEVYRPARSGTHAEHCGSREKTKPEALSKCKRTVDRLARYPSARSARRD